MTRFIIANAVGGALNPRQMERLLSRVMAAGGTMDVRMNDRHGTVRIEVAVGKGAPVVDALIDAGFRDADAMEWQ